MQTPQAQQRLSALLKTDVASGSVGVRLGMVNDWGSPSGFSYTLNFAKQVDVAKDDEKIELDGGGVMFVERKALWVGEGGLLGSTLDFDEAMQLIITPREEKPRGLGDV